MPPPTPLQEDAKYMINVRQYAKYVVKLGDKVSPTDIEEGMRVGVQPQKLTIQVRGRQWVRCADARCEPPI